MLEPTEAGVAVNPSELPDGFSMIDPTSSQTTMEGGTGQQQQVQQQQVQQVQKQQAIQEQKQLILDQACTQEALSRLGRIKLVKPEKATAVENWIISMAMQGKLPGPVNEGKLIEILERGSLRSSSSASAEESGAQQQRISIQRKKYAMDSDDEQDNDDDL